MTPTYEKRKQEGSGVIIVKRCWNCRSIGCKSCFTTFGCLYKLPTQLNLPTMFSRARNAHRLLSCVMTREKQPLRQLSLVRSFSCRVTWRPYCRLGTTWKKHENDMCDTTYTEMFGWISLNVFMHFLDLAVVSIWAHILVVVYLDTNHSNKYLCIHNDIGKHNKHRKTCHWDGHSQQYLSSYWSCISSRHVMTCDTLSC